MSTLTALITGGTSGIGLAAARALHDRGHRVAVTGQRPESVERARTELPDDVLVLRSDAGSLDAISEMFSTVAEHFGPLDSLFLNAGVNRPMTLENAKEEWFDEIFSINTKGVFFTLAKALPFLSDGASVIVTVGIGATRALTGSAVAAGSHGAILSMLPTLALELAPRGIRLNAVSPGMTDTPMTRSAIRTQTPDVEGTLAAMAQSNPFGRIATPEDIAGTVAFLASAESRYITGQEILVAGGAGLAL